MKLFVIVSMCILMASMIAASVFYFSSVKSYSIRYDIDKNGKFTFVSSRFIVINMFISFKSLEYFEKNSVIGFDSDKKLDVPLPLQNYFSKLSNDDAEYEKGNLMILILTTDNKPQFHGIITKKHAGKLVFESYSYAVENQNITTVPLK